MIQLYNKLFDYYKNRIIQNKIKSQINLGKDVRFWWRDDDVVDSTKELDILLEFSVMNNVPVYLAVIPKYLTDHAIEKIRKNQNASVMQHGYSHTNYNIKGKPLNEFGLDRDLKVQVNDINNGD